jgi:hypothetical protein
LTPFLIGVKWFGMRTPRSKPADAVAGDRYAQVGPSGPGLRRSVARRPSHLTEGLVVFRGALAQAETRNTLTAEERAALDDLIRAIATLLDLDVEAFIEA